MPYNNQPSSTRIPEASAAGGSCARFVKVRGRWHLSLAPSLAEIVEVGTAVTCDVETKVRQANHPFRHGDPRPEDAGRHADGALPHRGLPGRARQRRAQHLRASSGRRLGRAAPCLGVAAGPHRRCGRGRCHREIGPGRPRQGADHRPGRERAGRPPGHRRDPRTGLTEATRTRFRGRPRCHQVLPRLRHHRLRLRADGPLHDLARAAPRRYGNVPLADTPREEIDTHIEPIARAQDWDHWSARINRGEFVRAPA